MQTRNTRSVFPALLGICLLILPASPLFGCGDGDDSESPVLGEASAAETQLVQFAMAEISQYLATRPESADTAQGIHTFWILWEGELPPLAVTEKALEALEQSGLVERLQVGTNVIWRKRKSA